MKAVIFFLYTIFAIAYATGGFKDIAGNYYDYTTGQVSTVDGRVYSPLVYPASYISSYHTPVYPSPIVYSYLLRK